MKVSYLVMIQTLTHTVFSMSPPVVLKPRVMRCLMRLMSISDVTPQDPINQPQETSPNDTTPPVQGLDQDNQEEDVEPNDQGQKDSSDQGGDEDDGDKGEAPPHPRVHQNIQRDHPIDNILGDIEKEVTTRSHVANFCEHYSFIYSFEPFKVEDEIRDLD
jgi:cobalamin biosynthesis protein CobT